MCPKISKNKNVYYKMLMISCMRFVCPSGEQA